MDMMKATPTEIREKVFLIWYSLSRNDTVAAKEAKSQGFNTTRQSINTWKKKYGWIDRADNLDLKKLEKAEKNKNARDKLLSDLYARKAEYESFFHNLPVGKVDNQATYAYSQICSQIDKLTSSIEKVADVSGEKKGGTFNIVLVRPNNGKKTP